MEPNFNLTGHLATRETLTCPVLAKAWDAAKNVEKIVDAQNDEWRRLHRVNCRASFAVAMTRVNLKISKIGLSS